MLKFPERLTETSVPDLDTVVPRRIAPDSWCVVVDHGGGLRCDSVGARPGRVG
jgi:hypothetical protein